MGKGESHVVHQVITGGAGPEEAAAIAVAVELVLADESAQQAVPMRRPQQSDWVRAWRPRSTKVVGEGRFDGLLWDRGDDDDGTA